MIKKAYLKFIIGKKAYPVILGIDLLASRFVIAVDGFYPEVNKEIKDLDGAEFDFDRKVWTCKLNRRNNFCIDYLTKKSMIKKYLKPNLDLDWVRNKIKEKGLKKVEEKILKHQVEICAAELGLKTVIIGAEMRVGKTLPTLLAIEFSPVEMAWWIGPKNTLGELSRQKKAWGVNKGIAFMSYAAFRIKMQQGTYDRVPQFIVFDEAQEIKEPTSGQSEAAMEVSNLMQEQYGRNNFYIIELSGTPAPRAPVDWWHLVEVVEPGFLREPNRGRLERILREATLDESTAEHSFYRFGAYKPEEVNRLYKRLRGLVWIYFKKDVLDLPPKETEIVSIPPSKKVLTAAKAVVNNSLNSLAAVIRLRELSDGFLYEQEYLPETNDYERKTEYVGSPKEDKLIEDLTTLKDDGRVVVFTAFTATLDRLVEITLKEGWSVATLDSRGWRLFHDGEITNKEQLIRKQMDRSTNDFAIEKLAFIAQIDSAATGLELSAASVFIYYSLSNKGTSFQQSQDRGHSMNMDKEKGLLLKFYIHLPSDLKIYEAHQEKKSLQGISMGELKDVLDKTPLELFGSGENL
jgi:hypothetical protein